MSDESFWKKLKREWDQTPIEAKWAAALGLLLACAAGSAYAGSRGGEDGSSSSDGELDEFPDELNASSSFDAGYSRGESDGFWGNHFNDRNYAADSDMFSRGYSEGYEDGQSKDSV